MQTTPIKHLNTYPKETLLKWLEGSNFTPAHRKEIQNELDRRKAATPTSHYNPYK